MSTMRKVTAGLAIGALWMPIAAAADTSPGAAQGPSGAMPGDDALTCEQIYAQGMAEAQKDQQQRDQKLAQRKREAAATQGLITGAVMTGGLGGTGIAATMAVQGQADRQVAELGSPPPANPRLDHLKQLWAQKHCVKK